MPMKFTYKSAKVTLFSLVYYVEGLVQPDSSKTFLILDEQLAGILMMQ